MNRLFLSLSFPSPSVIPLEAIGSCPSVHVVSGWSRFLLQPISSELGIGLSVTNKGLPLIRPDGSFLGGSGNFSSTELTVAGLEMPIIALLSLRPKSKFSLTTNVSTFLVLGQPRSGGSSSRAMEASMLLVMESLNKGEAICCVLLFRCDPGGDP